jgi:hypothetical protein
VGLGIPAEYDALSDAEDPEVERTLAVLDATELSVVVLDATKLSVAMLDATDLSVVVRDDVKAD